LPSITEIAIPAGSRKSIVAFGKIDGSGVSAFGSPSSAIDPNIEAIGCEAPVAIPSDDIVLSEPEVRLFDEPEFTFSPDDPEGFSPDEPEFGFSPEEPECGLSPDNPGFVFSPDDPVLGLLTRSITSAASLVVSSSTRATR